MTIIPATTTTTTTTTTAALHNHGPQADMKNRLLGAMSAADYGYIAGNSHEIELVRGIDLVSPEEPILDCWFPLSGMVSIIAMTPSGLQTEVGVAGLEGFVDISTIHGGDLSIQRAVVQIPGRALRLKAAKVRAAMVDSPTFSALLLAYAQAFTVQMAGTALANAQFTIEQRLARWLLMCADRVGLTGIVLTHETLSIMLGVRRPGVTVALQHLERLAAIQTRRGSIQIINRDCLLGIAEDSYGAPETEYERLMAETRYSAASASSLRHTNGQPQVQTLDSEIARGTVQPGL
jgi:CRP-like cAMP-binding protein